MNRSTYEFLLWSVFLFSLPLQGALLYLVLDGLGVDWDAMCFAYIIVGSLSLLVWFGIIFSMSDFLDDEEYAFWRGLWWGWVYSLSVIGIAIYYSI